MIEYCRTSACALSGCTAGIMGLTGLQGFAFYFCAVIGLWVIKTILHRVFTLCIILLIVPLYAVVFIIIESWTKLGEVFRQ